mmetsp:Transcript_3270/g.10013  ORF Transcript_3270/g.10013 Transcript_3270/m.10013 type:complete len:188 (-) Transcript_3270:352-915(-)
MLEDYAFEVLDKRRCLVQDWDYISPESVVAHDRTGPELRKRLRRAICDAKRLVDVAREVLRGEPASSLDLPTLPLEDEEETVDAALNKITPVGSSTGSTGPPGTPDEDHFLSADDTGHSRRKGDAKAKRRVSPSDDAQIDDDDDDDETAKVPSSTETTKRFKPSKRKRVVKRHDSDSDGVRASSGAT